MSYSAHFNRVVYADNRATVEEVTTQIKNDIVKRLSEAWRTNDRLTTAGTQRDLAPHGFLSQIPKTNDQVEVCLRVECQGGGESCKAEAVSCLVVPEAVGCLTVVAEAVSCQVR